MTGFITLLFALAAPAASAPPSSETAMIKTKWSLEDAATAKPKVVGRRSTAARTPGATAEKRLKPRIYGGATVSNRRKRGSSGAKVGVALPF